MPSAKETIAVFARVVREQLEQGDTVEVPDLGTFTVEHQPSTLQEDPDGENYMAPPEDVVRFEPEQ